MATKLVARFPGNHCHNNTLAVHKTLISAVGQFDMHFIRIPEVACRKSSGAAT
jgi:hypothetical protein